MKEAVIVSTVRTPLGAFNGSLCNIGATDLGAVVIKEAVQRAGINKENVDEIIMGLSFPAVLARILQNRLQLRQKCHGRLSA